MQIYCTILKIPWRNHWSISFFCKSEAGVLTDVSVLVKEIFVDSVRVFEQSSSIDGGISVWDNDWARA